MGRGRLRPATGAATELLTGAPAGVAAFRAGRCAWGVQFHPEVGGGQLDGWYADYGAWLGEAGVSERDARAADDLHLPAQSELAERLFGAFAWSGAITRKSQHRVDPLRIDQVTAHPPPRHVSTICVAASASDAARCRNAVMSPNVEYLGSIKQDVGMTTGAKVVGDRMFVTSGKNISIYDISDPASPKALGAMKANVAWENEEVPTNGKVLAVASDFYSVGVPECVAALAADGCVQLFDVRDPADIKPVGTSRSPTTRPSASSTASTSTAAPARSSTPAGSSTAPRRR